MLLRDGKVAAQEDLSLEKGRSWCSGRRPGSCPRPTGPELGGSVGKGVGLEKKVTATSVRPGLVGADRDWLRLGLARPTCSCRATNSTREYGSTSRGTWLRSEQATGLGGHDFPAWSYTLKAATGELRLGYGWDIGRNRLSAGLDVATLRLWQEYGGGAATGRMVDKARSRGQLRLPEDRPALGRAVDIGRGDARARRWHRGWRSVERLGRGRFDDLLPHSVRSRFTRAVRAVSMDECSPIFLGAPRKGNSEP